MGSKMGCCVQLPLDEASLANEDEIEIPQLIQEHPSSQTSDSYKLNDLRSLEGIAELWSEQNNKNSRNSASKLSLQNTLSEQIRGNHTSHHESPITISTYYFVHAPIAEKQPNLLQSHSAPAQTTPILTSVQAHDSFPRKISEDTEEETSIINMELPELEFGRTNTRSPTMNSIGSNNNIVQFPFHSNPAMVPVFSFSNSMGSMLNGDDGTVPMWNNDTNGGSSGYGFHFNIGLDPIVSPKMNVPNTKMTPVRHTYSNRNVFTVSDDMDSNDFMEYQSAAPNLGVGASGIVTKAFHFSSCKMVAVKKCRSKQEHEIAAFEKEARLYSEYKDNENIVDMIGFGKDENNNESLIALEYFDLGSVESLKIFENVSCIQTRELMVGHIVLNVLNALNDLHNNLYVHNDVKPANILANKYGQIVLSDFGCIQKLQSMGDYLKKNNGTQRYQSPEKMIFDIAYNQKNDVWSLGITCYELLFGTNSFKLSQNDLEYTTNPPILKPNECGLSADCCCFINNCLTVERDDRPTSSDLLTHRWFENVIKPKKLSEKWPYLSEELSPHNEELLFMISSLVIYYSNKQFNDRHNGSVSGLHRRVSLPKDKDKRQWTDDQRIENIAKYANCSKDTVMDRIKVTVSYIKSQLK